VFSVGSVPRSYLEDNRRYKSSFEGWQLRGVLQGRLKTDGVIVELRVQLWNVNQWAAEAEESPLIRIVPGNV
jgi:hypothetical protein